MQQGRDLALVALDQRRVGIFLVARPAILHAVLFGVALDLAVAEHGQSGQRGHEGGDAEALVAGAELIDGGALVGIAHEVDIALHDVRIELEGVLDHRAVLGVFLVAHHVHEGAVVDAMHSEGADEVALHEPEGFGQQEGSGNLGGDAIDDFAPELLGHVPVEFSGGHGVLGARGDGSAAAGIGEPEALKVPLGESHGGVKADHRKQTRDVQDGLNDLLAHGGIQVVELGGIVPGKAGAIVAVIDVAGLATLAVAALEDHGGIGLLVVVAFDLDLDARVGRKVGTIEVVGGIRQVRARDEPVGMLDDPGRIDAHVVGHHVTGEADTAAVTAVAQGDVGGFSAEIVGDAVVVERIGGGDGILSCRTTA